VLLKYEHKMVEVKYEANLNLICWFEKSFCITIFSNL